MDPLKQEIEENHDNETNFNSSKFAFHFRRIF